MKKIKIKWTLDILYIVILSGLVFFTGGSMYVDVANLGLYEVIWHSVIVSVGGSMLVGHTKAIIINIFKLLPKDGEKAKL
tara:strand:- start:241 stop:480 length:240 start_codon:yes stop_codon:yes gene_type:complete